MNNAMIPPSKHAADDFDDAHIPEKLPDSRPSSRSDGGTLTPQRSSKSPVPTVRASARSTARSKKSTAEAKQM